jgi:hypothetical protein
VYRERALPVISRALRMLHEADATWLDEDYGAIHVRNRKAWIEQLVAEREAVESRLKDVLREFETERQAARRALDDLRNSYESKPMMRLSRALHERVDRLPAPVASRLRWLFRLVGRHAVRARR